MRVCTAGTVCVSDPTPEAGMLAGPAGDVIEPSSGAGHSWPRLEYIHARSLENTKRLRGFITDVVPRCANIVLCAALKLADLHARVAVAP